jgi:hypothetical protein
MGYAFDNFDARWHPLLEDAVAFWRGKPAPAAYRLHPARRRRDAADFVDAVIQSANHLR